VGEARAVIHRTFTSGADPESVLRGDVRAPDGPSPDTAIVVVHGFKGFKDWGFFPYLCERLADAGHAVVSFNLSHNGIGDDPLEFTELERFARNTLSRELDEVQDVIDEVLSGSLLGEVPRALGVVGHSRGGGQAVLATAEHDGIDALVTWAAVADFDRWSAELRAEWRDTGRIFVSNARTGQQMPLDVTLLEDLEANRDRLDIEAAARRLAVPWLVVHGLDDETVAAEEGRRLAGWGGDTAFVGIAGAGHTFQARHPFSGAPPELEQAIDETIAHFAEHLRD